MDWVFKHGYFNLMYEAEGGNITKLVHRPSMQEKELPMKFKIPASEAHLWAISDNHFEKDAALVNQSMGLRFGLATYFGFSALVLGIALNNVLLGVGKPL